MTLLPVPHIKQRQQADCLAACAAMVLAYHRITVSYRRLLAVLDVRRYGAPSTNIRRIEQLGCRVSYKIGEAETIRWHLHSGNPCILFLRTKELPYWSTDTGHAIVVTGFDDDGFYVNDPASNKAPHFVSEGDLVLAWLEFDYEFAVIEPEFDL